MEHGLRVTRSGSPLGAITWDKPPNAAKPFSVGRETTRRPLLLQEVGGLGGSRTGVTPVCTCAPCTFVIIILEINQMAALFEGFLFEPESLHPGCQLQSTQNAGSVSGRARNEASACICPSCRGFPPSHHGLKVNSANPSCSLPRNLINQFQEQPTWVGSTAEEYIFRILPPGLNK